MKRALVILGLVALAGCGEDKAPSCPYAVPPPCPGGGTYSIEGDGSDHTYKSCRLDGELHGPFWSCTDDGPSVRCGAYNHAALCGREMTFIMGQGSCDISDGYEEVREIKHEACPF